MTFDNWEEAHQDDFAFMRDHDKRRAAWNAGAMALAEQILDFPWENDGCIVCGSQEYRTGHVVFHRAGCPITLAEKARRSI